MVQNIVYEQQYMCKYKINIQKKHPSQLPKRHLPSIDVQYYTTKCKSFHEQTVCHWFKVAIKV